MTKHCALIIFALALSLMDDTAVAQQPPTHMAPKREFAYGAFSVRFPQAPEVTREALPNTKVISTSYSYKGPTFMLMVVVLDMGREGTEKQQTAVLDGGMQNVLQKVTGLKVSPEGVTHIILRGHPGRRLNGTFYGGRIYFKAFATPRLQFQVEAMYDPADDAARKAAEAFVDSFALKI